MPEMLVVELNESISAFVLNLNTGFADDSEISNFKYRKYLSFSVSIELAPGGTSK